MVRGTANQIVLAVQNNTKHRAGSRAIETFPDSDITYAADRIGPKMGPSPISMRTEAVKFGRRSDTSVLLL